MICGHESRLYVDDRIGGVQRLVLGDPGDLMRIPDPILSSAVFLCVDDGGTVRPGGTGFFLTVESETRNDTHSYLVTARHSVEAAKPYGKLYARLNSYDGGDAALVELPCDWKFHEDREANDVAVLPFPAPQLYEVMTFDRDALVTPNVLPREHIGIGDDLMVVGLYRRHYGRKVNRPIVRSGVIAAMADEPVEDLNAEAPFEAYLGELRSIGGLSGSPVWVVINPSRLIPDEERLGWRQGESRWRFYLLGLIRSHWSTRDDEERLSEPAQAEGELLNTGIASITPIQKALDIIDSKTLVKQRKDRDRERAERARRSGEGEVLDSGLSPNPEFERFEDLTRKLVNTPKDELDEKRRGG